MEADIREYENSIPAGASEVPASDTSIGRAKPADNIKNRKKEEKNTDREKRSTSKETTSKEKRTSDSEERKETSANTSGGDSNKASDSSSREPAAVPTPSSGVSKTR
jgi:hypothetical protein